MVTNTTIIIVVSAALLVAWVLAIFLSVRRVLKRGKHDDERHSGLVARHSGLDPESQNKQNND